MGLLSRLAGSNKEEMSYKEWLRYESNNLTLDNHVARVQTERLSMFTRIKEAVEDYKADRDYYKGR